MRKPILSRLDKYLNLIIRLPFEEFSKRFFLQGTAEYALELVDKLCIINKLDGKDIKGVLFSVRCYNYDVMEYKNSVILITDLDYNSFKEEIEELYLMDTIKEDDPKLNKLIEDEDCMLIYGNYELVEKIGTDRLPQPFLVSYK